MSKLSLSISSSNRRKKAIAVIVEVMLLFAVMLAIFFSFIAPQYNNDYNASLIDKMNRLESIESPKIVLIGNSNLAFGMRSEMLEEAFGMPVVNMGLHGGLGNKFHENMAKKNVNRSDIIIILHTDYREEKTTPAVASLMWITIENNCDLWDLIDLCDIPAMIEVFPKYMKNSIWRFLNKTNTEICDEPQSQYKRSAFNEYGDNVYSAANAQSYTFSANDFPEPKVSQSAINRINKLNEYITKRGATLLIAGTPVGDGEFTPDKIVYLKYEDELKTSLNCEVISNVSDYFFDYDCFYDTMYHMNDKGAKMRTEQLIKDLTKYFDQKKN